jgi:hypothetical protein
MLRLPIPPLQMARWLVLAACLLVAGALAMPEDKAVVTTQYGPVRGVLTDGVYAWRGVPYGASTGGANRFRPPVPPSPWTQVRDATQWGPGCPQYAENADAPTKQDEDCTSSLGFSFLWAEPMYE